MENNSSNWVETAVEVLKREFPEVNDEASVLASRLAELLYERLPSGVRRELGEGAGALSLFAPEEPADRSVGYATFVERSRLVLACSQWEGSTEELDRLAKRVTDCFFWSISKSVDQETLGHLRSALPYGTL